MEPSSPVRFSGLFLERLQRDLEVGDVLQIPLFDGRAGEWMISGLQHPGPGRSILRAALRGDRTADLQLAVRGFVGAGLFTFHDGERIFLEPGSGGLRLVRLNSDWSPACAAIRPPASSHMAQGEQPTPTLQGPEATNLVYVADVLVAYTSDARVGAGGAVGMAALIDLAEAQANDVLEASRTRLRIRVVHQTEIAYVESGNLNTDLTRLRDTNDGQLDVVHALRNTHQADLVCLFVERSDSNVAGIAYVMSPVQNSFRADAFSVVQRSPALAYHVFIHELGHNFGCHHDRAANASGGAFAYSHGHKFQAEFLDRHTVMALSPGRIVPQFSNPAITFKGVPTGIAAGQPNAADNALSIHNAAPTIAAFRMPAVTTTLPAAEIAFPTNGAAYYDGVSLTVTGAAVTGNGTPASVELRSSSLGSIGVRTNAPYSFSLNRLAVGQHDLRLKVTDGAGFTAHSPEVLITVSGTPPDIDPSASRFEPDGSFRVRVIGAAGQSFVLERSPDLAEWRPLTTNTLPGSAWDFSDAAMPAGVQRFYRITPR